MISIRTIRPGDVNAVAKLVKDAGFPVRSAEGWKWAFFDNPDQGDIPAGLVAERRGRLVAVIGLQARQFTAHGRDLTAICGHTFISGIDGRGAGFALARRALQSHGGAAIYTLNNNALAGDFHKRIGLSAWLGPRGRERIEWPIHSVTMAAGHVMTRLARNEDIYDWLSKRELFRGGPSTLEKALPMRGKVLALNPVRQGDAGLIDDLNAACRMGYRAVPNRAASVYGYQMADPDAPGRIALLGLEGRNGLDGMIQLAITKPNAYEPAELEVIDLAVRPSMDPAIAVPMLINASKSVARNARLSRLKMPFSARFESVCYAGTGLRFARTMPYDLAHAAFLPEGAALQQDWSPSGFAGDLFFALRVPPASTRSKVRPATQENFHGATWERQAPEA
ncbi:MAG: hypothetical protein VX593_08165 [Pseudomonadota bacterium]|nr:hypothetical protein [Pseudomonadota bacterium]